LINTSEPTVHSDYLVFVDESGDHSLTSIDDAYPLFVLCFCIIKKSVYVNTLVPRIKTLKIETFGHDCVVLHEADIRRKRGAFSMLSKEPQEAFLETLTTIIEDLPMTVVAVVIDKRKLNENTAPHITLTILEPSTASNGYGSFSK
jgi:Protein of unknown function (DUF3800)